VNKQHVNLPHGLSANFNVEHFLGAVGTAKKTVSLRNIFTGINNFFNEKVFFNLNILSIKILF